MNQMIQLINTTIQIIVQQKKPADAKSSTYIDFITQNIEKNPKFQIGDIVRISKLKTFLPNVTLHTDFDNKLKYLN